MSLEHQFLLKCKNIQLQKISSGLCFCVQIGGNTKYKIEINDSDKVIKYKNR